WLIVSLSRSREHNAHPSAIQDRDRILEQESPLELVPASRVIGCDPMLLRLALEQRFEEGSEEEDARKYDFRHGEEG
ncbi:hypothetical protein, partial [Rhizobium ruizarguesonis]|uniref:hypothetical protein n=1 Tax=Rhizobium ruizarguesonis TaxID=2081791 RepID=UPI001952FF16